MCQDYCPGRSLRLRRGDPPTMPSWEDLIDQHKLNRPPALCAAPARMSGEAPSMKVTGPIFTKMHRRSAGGGSNRSQRACSRSSGAALMIREEPPQHHPSSLRQRILLHKDRAACAATFERSWSSRHCQTFRCRNIASSREAIDTILPAPTPHAVRRHLARAPRSSYNLRIANPRKLLQLFRFLRGIQQSKLPPDIGCHGRSDSGSNGFRGGVGKASHA